MGPSKFPGKPSKLVQKKRVSVVNAKSANIDNNTNNRIDGKYQPKYSASDQCDVSETNGNSTSSSITTTATKTTAFGATADADKCYDGDAQVRIHAIYKFDINIESRIKMNGNE